MYNCLTILILVLSLIFNFISCSGEDTNGGSSGTPGTTGGEVENNEKRINPEGIIEEQPDVITKSKPLRI